MTVARANRENWQATTCPEMTLAHIEDMWTRWSDEMSPTKKCRWLGWMQATVVAMAYPHVTLELFKQVNMDCASVDIDPVRDALAPVLHWYQSDEDADRSTGNILEDMVSDLQRDREDALLLNQIMNAAADPKNTTPETAFWALIEKGLQIRTERRSPPVEYTQPAL